MKKRYHIERHGGRYVLSSIRDIKAPAVLFSYHDGLFRIGEQERLKRKFGIGWLRLRQRVGPIEEAKELQFLEFVQADVQEAYFVRRTGTTSVIYYRKPKHLAAVLNYLASLGQEERYQVFQYEDGHIIRAKGKG